jgi:hypothetical protein
VVKAGHAGDNGLDGGVAEGVILQRSSRVRYILARTGESLYTTYEGKSRHCKAFR